MALARCPSAFASFPLVLCLLPFTSCPLLFCLLPFVSCHFPLALCLLPLTSYPLPPVRNLLTFIFFPSFRLALWLMPFTSCHSPFASCPLPLACYLFPFPTSFWFLHIAFCSLSVLPITFYAPLLLIICILPLHRGPCLLTLTFCPLFFHPSVSPIF